MLKRTLKVLGYLFGGLLVLVLLAGVAVYLISQSRIDKTYAITPAPVAIPTDADALREGGRLAMLRGCAGCHTPNLAGDPTFIAAGPLGTIAAPNLTSGSGGIGASYSDADWVRAIRHGVGKDGKALWIMPSHEFYLLSDRDLGAIIAFVKSVPPVDATISESSLGFLGRVLFVTGQLPLLPAERIAHDAPRPAAPEVAVTAEYGGYLAPTCSGCHGANYSGGPLPGAQADEIPAANLTPAGVLPAYTEAQFIDFMHTGTTPTGRQIAPEVMPARQLGTAMTETELKALYLFLTSLPATQTGQR